MSTKSISIQVSGKVQGVWFRASTRNKAVDLGISGTVQNTADGSVYIEAFGAEEQLNQFVRWCREGPRHARVESVEVNTIEEKSFEDFRIIR